MSHSTVLGSTVECDVIGENMDTQVNAYLVTGYACNQRCRCCPITHNSNTSNLIIPFEQIKDQIIRIGALGVTDVTISGGEPTLHPRFFDILESCYNEGLNVHLLTNGEKFSDEQFIREFLKKAHKEETFITTTFHSHHPALHEQQNLTNGSFARSFRGLQALDNKGFNLAIKHCITSKNYHSLTEFVRWVLFNFTSNTEIQLWGIDVSGVNESLAREYYVDYKQIGPHLENAIDLFEEQLKKTPNRVLTINNLPLCICDAYYWQYYTPPEADNYIEHLKNGKKMDAISGPASENCTACGFHSFCPGVYYSNFEIFGNDIVSPPVQETAIVSHRSKIVSYKQERLVLTYLSPCFQIELRPSGYKLWNSRTGMYVQLRVKTKLMQQILSLLDEGVDEDMLKSILNNAGENGEEVVNELVLKGVIE